MNFVKRPLAVLTMSFFALFCVFANAAPLRSAAAIAVAGAAFLLSAVLSFTLRKNARTLSRYIALAAAGALAASVFAFVFFGYTVREYDRLAGNDHELCGTVREKLWSSSDYNCFSFDVSAADGEEVSFGAALMTAEEFAPGDEVRAECFVSKNVSSTGFDSEGYYLSHGIVLFAKCESAEKTGEAGGFRTAAAKLNTYLSSVLSEHLSDGSAAIGKAVLLGNRSGLSAKTKSDFSSVGISHLIAISGMHVSFICAGLYFVFRRLRFGMRTTSVILIGAMVFYMFLTGFAPSVTRAALVACVALAFRIFKLPSDSVTSLSLCGAVMIAVNPYLALNAAMLLSFCAFAGCLAASSLIKRSKIANPEYGTGVLRRVAAAVLKPVIFTATVMLVSLPVMLLYYKKLSLISPLSNLIFIPAFSMILYLSVLVLIFSPIAPACAAASFVADKFIGAVTSLAGSLAKIPGTSVSLKYPHVPYVAVALSALIFALVFVKGRRVKRAVIAGLAASALVFGAGVGIYEASRPGVAVIRTGSASTEAIGISSGGEGYVVDLSGGGRFSASECISALEDFCVTDADCLIIARCTYRHLETVKYLLDRTELKRVMILEEGADPDAAKSVSAYLALRGTECRLIRALPDVVRAGCAVIGFSAATSDGSLPPALCIKISGKEESAAYYGSDWYRRHPNAAALLGRSEYVIFGSYGGKIGKPYPASDIFDNCKICSFAGRSSSPEIKGAIFSDENSTVVLEFD